jgi:hypothetical protein
MVKLLERFTKFRLLVAKDVATFVSFPLVMWLSTFLFSGYSQSARKLLFAVALGTPLGLLHRFADKRIRRLPDPLTSREKHLHAIVTLVGYVFWLAGILCVAIMLREPSVWALTSVIVPVLCVFCYLAVRTNLKLEPLIGPKPSNQAMQRTAVRSDA